MKYSGEELVEALTEIIYNEEFVNRAGEYLVNERSLDMGHFRVLWTLSGTDHTPFKSLERSGLAKSWLFESSLFIPAVSVSDPNRIEGYDIRYLGTNPRRTRYFKIQREPNSFLLYNIGDVVEHPEYPLVITEGATDAETLRSLELKINVISPLRNRHGIPFCMFLHSIADKIYIAYDQDKEGNKSKDKILKTFDITPELRHKIKPLTYLGKDPNKSLVDFGIKQLRERLEKQIDFDQNTGHKRMETALRNIKV